MKFLKSENFIIFAIVFTLAGAAGLYLNLVFNFVFADALKRTFMAYSVFFGNEPKLSAIGFVWPPLPTLLQLPLVLFEPLNNSGVAGNILSAIFLGISTIYLNLLAKLFSVKRVFRYVFLFLFVTNPLIFFYGINGMAEMVAIGFVIMTLYYFLKYATTKKIPSLIFSSLSLACAVMTRWEMGTLLFVLLLLIGYIPFINKKYTLKEAESSMVLFSIPIIFVVFVWLIMSWLIVGSPTYFLNSEYSFTAHDAKLLAENEILKGTTNNILQSILFTLKRILYLSPFFIPLGILMLNKLRDKNNRLSALVILGVSLCIIAAHTLLLYTGKSYGELRYFIYVIPFGFIFLLFLFRDTINFTLKKYKTTFTFLVAALFMTVSSVLTYKAMSLPEFGNQEHAILNTLQNPTAVRTYPYEKEKKIAEYITANIHDRSVIVDDSVGFIIVYLTKNPHLFIETVDSDFKEMAKNPLKSQAKYILISDQDSHSGIDILNVYHPSLFKEGGSFVTLEKDFGNWRLYKIGEKQVAKVATIPEKCEYNTISGDSLWTISENTYGDGQKYTELLKLNPEVNPNTAALNINQTLSVPCKQN